MKIAIPVWEEKISPVLDTASRILVVEMEGRRVTSRFEIFLDEKDISRRCFRIQGLGVDLLICGAVSRPFSRMLAASGVEIIPEISGQAEDVLEAFLKGTLFRGEFMMPGCGRGARRGCSSPGPRSDTACCNSPGRRDPSRGVKGGSDLKMSDNRRLKG